MSDKRDLNKVAVVGAGGHVGLPLCLVLAEAKFEVTGIETNEELLMKLSKGIVPYIEEGAEELLKKGLEQGNLHFTDKYDLIADSDILIVVIGTPVDESLNPRIDPLIHMFEQHKNLLHKNQLIILRSTVSPGTTNLVKLIVEDMTGMTEGRDFYLVFAPERVMQTKAIREIKSLPQLIGAFSKSGFERAKDFFQKFIRNRCILLSPIEVEMGKLITNMARYVSFALVNEFYIIADTFGANIHKVIKACNLDYPRLDLPKPGPNVGGPCLYKDGHYLVEKIPFPEIIDISFKINESIPMYLLEKVRRIQNIKKAGILGMSFKPNCDDTRNSLSFKLRKQLRSVKCEVVEVDPYIPEFKSAERLKGVDALFLMTRHDEFRDLNKILKYVKNPDCIIVDMWNFWEENEDLSHDGIYRASSIKDK